MTPRRGLRLALVGLVASIVGACGVDASAPSPNPDGADATDDSDGAELIDLTGQSVYHLTALVSDSNQTLVLDRNLTGREADTFAFGSSHIAPAVSLAVTDSVTVPRTMVITLNFGIVVASDEHPIDTDGPGVYAFAGGPPEVELAITGLQYRSRVHGSSGSVVVDAWSVSPGEAVSGRFSGTLIQDTPSEHKRQVEVEGWFHFTLPAPDNGQPH